MFQKNKHIRRRSDGWLSLIAHNYNGMGSNLSCISEKNNDDLTYLRNKMEIWMVNSEDNA